MKVVISDNRFGDISPERAALDGTAELLALEGWPGPEVFLRAARDADGVLVNMAPITADLLAGLERCRVIVRYGVGVDNIDTVAAARQGIAVCNVPDYCTEEVADHTLALILALTRRLPAARDLVRGGGWGHQNLPPIRRLSTLTLGLWGFGRIARAVAQRARCFGFRLLAHDPLLPEVAFAGTDVRRVDRDELLAESHVLSLHMPLADSTRHLLDREALARVRPGVFLVNTARGGLIDPAALLEALDSGRVAGAALDVLEREPPDPADPLLARDNVLVTPHLAWCSVEALQQLQRQVGEECARVLRGEAPRSCVNGADPARRVR